MILVAEIKRDFQYFYPVDSRHSGRDLVPNHLTFFVLNHTAIFPREYWPKEIVVNGSVLMNGSKMSKSMGNIIPLRKAVRDYGADPIRLSIIILAELLQDADFNLESVIGMQNKLESFYRECSRLKAADIGILQAEDTWIISKTQIMISQVTGSIEKMRLREALHEILFAFESDLSWYVKRAKAKDRQDHSGILHRVNSVRVAMLSPFAPHIAEEIWEILGHSKEMPVSKTRWPEYSDEEMNITSIQSEDLLKSTINDIGKILRVAKITNPQKIIIYTSSAFKSRVYHSILEKVMGGQTNMGIIMKELIADPDTADVKRIPDFVQKTIKDILSVPTEIRQARKESAQWDEKGFLAEELVQLAKKEFDVADMTVYAETDPDIYDPEGKARHAKPFKPAIYIQ